jgi:hypothetical protein
VENRSAVREKLGHGALGSPVDEDIAIGQKLGRPLRFREKTVRREECLDELSLPRRGVDLDDLATACRSCVNLVAASIFGAMSAVVVKADDFYIVVPGDETSVMLEAKLAVVRHLEGRSLTIETPNDLARLAIDLVHGASITCRNQIVSVCVFVDAVDMEVVSRVRAVVTGPCLPRVDG